MNKTEQLNLNKELGIKPQTIPEQLLTYFTSKGYQDVRINLWHEARLYVNIKGEIPFSYKLDDNFKVASGKLLPPHIFAVARNLTPMLRRNKKELVNAMGERYYTSKTK